MRVVVVDPSRTVLKAVSRLLMKDGHEVSTFVDGPEALAFIKSNAGVSALIASAELTTMSGIELCWETRLLSGHDRAIYIILMSSNSDKRHLINALDGGADEFIGKPPVEEELYARLRSAERLIRLQRELIRLAMVDPLDRPVQPPGVLREGAPGDRAGEPVQPAGRDPVRYGPFQAGQRHLRARRRRSGPARYLVRGRERPHDRRTSRRRGVRDPARGLRISTPATRSPRSCAPGWPS